MSKKRPYQLEAKIIWGSGEFFRDEWGLWAGYKTESDRATAIEQLRRCHPSVKFRYKKD